MANPNDNLRRLYQNGLKHFSLPDFDTFSQDMKDEEKRRRFYTNMQDAYSLPDFDTFSKDIGAVAVEPVQTTTTTAQPQQQSTPATVKPITDTTAQQASVTSSSQPAPAQGWKPSPVQQMEFNRQMDEMNGRMQQQKQQFEQRMEGIKKGNKPGAFMGEREFNPQTGQFDTHYYTTQGERVGTQMEQSQKNTAHHQWWENNTEEGKRSKERRLQREFDEQLSLLWHRHNPAEGLNAAEQAWSASEERQKAARNRNASKHWDSYAAMGGGREMRVVTTSMNRHDDMVDHLNNFDLDRLMDDSWNNLGEDGQQSLIDDCYKMLKHRNPGVDELVLYNQAKDFARQQSDLRLYNLAVEKNLPQNNLDYLMRKIGDMNVLMNISKGLAVSQAKTTGDMAAYEAANEQYRQDGHKILDVAGTVTGFALDPTTWLSAGVGGAATKGATWAGGRFLAGRGATAAVTNAATRQFATSMTGRIVGGVVGGAANFGTFEGIKEMENQFAHGGHIVGTDEVGRYINEGYSASAVGGQALHGFGMGAAIGWLTPVSGNVADKLVRGTSSTIGKVAGRAGVYTGATMAEGTIFSIPEWMEGNRDGFDVWTDNMAMMVGFKAKHMLKSAGGVLGDLKASFESPTNGSKNRLDFESRLRQRMDAPSDGGLALTKDEEAELKRYGYDLRELVESAEKTGNAAEGSLIAENAPEIVSRLTDMVNDTRISEAARAKMYYYATGRKLPMSTVMRGEIIEDGEGGFIVESQGANGVITSRSFKDRKAADLELERINRQTELNHIEIGERYQQTVDFENRLQEACRTVAEQNGWNAVEVYRTCEEARRNHLRGGDKQFDEAQQNILRKVTEAMGEFSETGVTDAMRGSINEKYGVDIDAAIRKEANRRTQAEQTAIDEYLGELIPDKAKEHPVEDAEAEDITNQKQLTSESEPPANEFGEGDPIDPRFNGGEPTPDYDPHQPDGEQKPIGRAVMKYQDRQVEVLSGRVVLTSDGKMIDNEHSDNSIIIRDIETGKTEMVSPEAILSYEEYAPEPVMTEAELPIDQQPEEAAPTEQSKYTSGQIKIRNSDGSETRGVLTGFVDEDGKHEYYVEGDLQHLHYATENELDNILSDYQPDAPQEPIVPKDSQGNDLAVGDEVVLSAGRTGVISEIKPDGSIAVDHNGETVTYNEKSGDITATGLRKVVQTPPVEENHAASTDEAFPTPSAEEVNIDISHTPTEPVTTPAPAQTTEGAALPNGITAVGSINVPQQDGSTRTFTVGKNAEGENVVLDESGFLWGHDGTGANMQPHRPGSNVPIWTDEQIAQFGAVETPNEQPTTVPENAETVPNPAENAAPMAENEPEAVSTVEPTPLQRIPRNEKGEPIFEQAETPELGWDALVEFSEGDATTAKEMADIMVENKRKAFEKAQKLKPKGKTPTEILASKKANAAELAKTQAEYEHWLKMSGVEQSRQNAIRAEQEAEARRLAAERAEQEKAEKAAREEADRIEREALNGIPEWHMDTPENARARGSRRFSGQLFTRQEPVQGVVGKEVEVKFSQKDLPKGRYVVIDASELQPSHLQGYANPKFFLDEAQPKNRAEAVSAHSAREIAENINPEEIIIGTTAYSGAPVVTGRGETIQGHNRSDALIYLWENNLPEQQSKYLDFISRNAEALGIDMNEVANKRKPVVARMLDVDDAEAIRLGQMTAQDTESGGIERIKPKNVAQKLGDDMRQFANMLLRSGDEEATFGQLVDRNGTDVMKWMSQVGAISNTQYQSAFDSKGNLTAEAKNDLQKVLYQAVFKGGSQQLEEMFDKLPAKAQRAILATAFRDMDSPFAGKLLPEIQASIVAFNLLMSDPTFAEAKKMEEVVRAIDTFKATIALDDKFEQHMPADNFSNFALHLAGMYKANDMSQTTIASYFNQMYDLAQGKKEATLFEEADTTEYPLADVIKKVLNIDYKPAKNGNNNVANGGADVALRNQVGQGGELRGAEPPASGEQTPAGTEPSDRGAGVEDDSAAAGGRNTDVRGGNSDDAANGELAEEVTPSVGPFGEIYTQFKGKPQEAVTFLLAKRSGEAIGALHHKDIGDIDLVWGKEGTAHSDGYGLAKLAKFHPEVLFNLQDVLNDMVVTKRSANRVQLESEKYQAAVRLTWDDKKKTWLLTMFEKKNSVPDNTTDTVETLSSNGNDTATPENTVISSETSTKTEPQQPNNAVSSDSSLPTDEQSGTSSIEPNGEPTVSDRKDTQSLTDKQISADESSLQPYDDKGVGLEQPSVQASVQAASAEVNTEPTPAQAEAGNYKKGHVTIGDFDITIENPAGSIRKGVDADGKEWQTTMANAYGYIKGTESVDGDHIDVFLHTDMDEWNGRKVYVVDQTRPDGSFDEHKVMLGFNDKDAAMSAYLANYDETWAQTHPGLRISEANLEDFDKWIKSSHRKTKPFADYTNVSKITDNAPTEQSATAITGNGYKVESKPYINKQNKTLDTYLVTFDRDFSKEEMSALRAKAKALKGWYDRDTKGWMLRSVDDAKAFAEDIVGKSEDEVADEAPLSMADMDKDVEAATGIEYSEEDEGESTTNEPETSYNSERNSNFANSYETKDGETIKFSSENPEAYGVPEAKDGAVDSRTGDADIQRQGGSGLEARNNRLNTENGEFSLVERVFTETGSFNFTSGERIESADDVAFIFSALEDRAKEHSFVVLVKDGKPTVVELGMGSFNATMVDIPTAALAYDRIRPEEVYFVHNHPSGNLKCSPQDVQMLKKFEDMCDVPVHGVIINLKTGHYGTFDTSGGYGVGSKRTPDSASPLTVHTLDKQIFAPDYDPMMQLQVRSSEDVAAFLNSHRMGDRAKVSFLILSRANKIVGNIHTPYTNIPADADEMARYISERVIQFGGESAILYGDFAIDHSESGAFNKLKQSLQKVGGTNLLDVVNVEGNYTRSANNEGLLYEPGSEYGASANSDIRFRKVEDDKVLTEFAEGKTVKAYRTMQVIDGKLYSPMATKVGGKTTPEIKLGVPEQSEEHPEIIKGTKIGKDGIEQGYVVIDKGLGKGTLTVAYNPYAHTSRTVLNDQFSSAYIRPNLVTVEVEVPESELTSGYRAHMAKDVVGEISWHSGSVSGQLADLGKPRRVILTRYDKPVRIVPFKEVAEMIASQLDGTDIAIPYNVVQPQLRAELERLGVTISEEATGSVSDAQEFGKAEYITDQEIERINAHQQEMAQTSPEAKRGHAEKLSKKFNTPIRIVDNPAELTHDDPEMQKRMRKSKGFYNTATGEVVVVVPNNATVEDVAETVFHEVVAHKGLREIIGEENYDAFCDEVYDHLKDDLKQQIDEETTRRFMNDPSKKHEAHRREAVDEMFGRMSEKGFEDFTKAERGIWAKLKAKVLEAINKFLGPLKLPKWVKLGDNELRYMLWRSHEKLRGKGDYVTTARDVVKRNELGLTAEIRFKDGETDDIWKDRSVGLEERITNAAIRLANNQSADLTLRNDAMRAVTNNLQSLLHSMRNRRGTTQSFAGADCKVEAGVVDAMNAQAMYDRSTVKRVADLARILMQHGYLSGMTSGEMQRLLSAVKNATAMHDTAEYVQKIMDIMVDNQLRNGEATLRNLLAIRGSKVDARGVEVQGALDVEGQRTMEVVKKAMSLKEDDINDRIAEALNRMSDPDQTIADQAAIEYAGLNMALDYVQNIADSKAEEKALRDSLKTAKEDRDAGRITDDAYKQFVEATQDAIRKNKIERAEAYFNLVGRLSDSLRESIENAKAFREAEKARVNMIHHNANSDMEGRPTNEHHKDDWKDKVANNGFVQFLFSPLATFDQVMRVFGNKSANGEGYLWNRFMRGWVDCRNKELSGVKDKFAQLDEKAAELFGKGKTWGDIIRMESKLPKATVSFWDGGEMRDHELTQGNLLYIYMVDKMTDGRMKLRRMGITEQDIANIETFLDPRFKAIGDWLQDEFLVATRNEYNETHKRMFGASMAAIENYFPLKILANARIDKEEDVNQPNRPDGITTKTGSIIKRRVNNLALDITGADALSVILDHITQMEHWNAYAEWNRDLNTLRTYKRFRNQVINMTTVYGGGRKLWENFNDLCLMAAGEYRPPIAKLDKSAVNIAKGVTAAKVSFRMFTALKQLLSAPAYAPEVSIRSIAKSIANPYGDFKWCMENMPIFRERWHSRISGDPRLLKNDKDWNMWRSRVMEICSRIGMTPNAFVDAVTVSIGARAMYETRLKLYLREGYPADAAEGRAKQDAAILFNQTQQSSESPFLSTMQVDRSWLSVLFTVFRNSAMSYTRQEFDAMRNLKRNLTPGQRAKSVEFMTKQILRDWNVDPDNASDADKGKAEDVAKKRFRRQIKKDIIRLATFGFILEFAWNLGPYLPYIIFGNDEDEKDKMWDDATTHAYFGSVEGLTGGDVMSSFGNMATSGEWSFNQLTKDMPMASDINSIANKFIAGKNAEAINDIIFLVVQSGIGMNPQSITDTAVAIMDACGDDPALSHEAAIFVSRVLQVPQSQIDKMYFDEIGLSGEEASKLTPAQLAQRYAEYKVKRGTPLAPWAWDDEERTGKYLKSAETKMKERMESQGDADVIETYNDMEARYKAVSEKVKEAKNLMKTDYAAAAQAHAALQQDPDFGLYQRFGSLDKQLARISKMWLSAKTPEEAALVSSTIPAYRAGMVKVLQSETAEAQQSAMAELTTLMNEFYAKYQTMQPNPMQPNR